MLNATHNRTCLLQGAAVILATNDVAEAEPLRDRVAFLHQGCSVRPTTSGISGSTAPPCT